ncbi:MAG TPA: alpha/beta family hydrolase [Solirubrobacteraceae bacterium]|nr:alpha/beta family hydrolase [Solirubrobacteraceae bacterium]
MTELIIDTPRGPARAHLTVPDGVGTTAGALILGHGAGGGVRAPDLLAAQRAALAGGWAVALVEQPYRVAGRRSPAPAPHLDEAWTAVVARLRAGELAGRRLITGGRSSGARVACRTAAATAAAGVMCLAFPLTPPRRANATTAAVSRLPELDAVGVPTLVIQGVNDRFGMPPAGPGRTVVQVAGDHALKADLPAAQAAVGQWLAGLPA